MNKKLFFSLLLLSSASIHAMAEEIEATGQKMENMAENASANIEDAARDLGNKIEAAGEAMADKAGNMTDNAEAKNIFEKIKDFIMGIVSSIMNFFHGLFGG